MSAGAARRRKTGGCIPYTLCTPPVHRRGAAFGLGLVLLLAGCVETELPGANPEIPYRNPTVTLAGSTRFDPSAFAGDWYIVARFADDVDTTRTYLFNPLSEVMLEREGEETREYEITGPGILSEKSLLSERQVVVMWVDEGFRTAVLGTAKGTDALILDRRPDAAPDRFAAAVEVLDFNGWDTTRLQRISE